MKRIFLDAMDTPLPERARVLDEACAGFQNLRSAVQALLKHDQRASPLDTPLTESEVARLLPSTDTDEDSLGPLPSHIGPYLITGVLGMGASGVVYLARQTNPDREVALKVLRTDAPLLRRRFERESQFLAALRHPGIAHVYDRGVDPASRLPYIAMELVPAARLITAFATDRGLDLEARVRLLLQACDAMAHAHAAGVLHRDLKPANLLTDADGAVKIVDFGVGRWLTSPGTLLGGAVGSLEYASPEQIRGEGGAPADVFSLGVVLYELLCGRTPYACGTPNVFQSVRRMESQPPTSPRRLNPACPAELEAVMLKAIEPATPRRYGTVAQFADDLRRALAGEAVLARRDSALRAAQRLVHRHPATTTAIAALLLGSGAWGIWAWRQQDRQLQAAAKMSAAALSALDFIETRSGSTPIRHALTETYLPVTEELVRARPADRDARYLLARLYDARADLCYESSNLPPILGLRQRSLELMSALAAEAPNSIEYTHRHSLAIIRVGDAERDRGDLGSAAKRYTQALEIQERLLAAGASDPALLDDLGWSYLRQANLRYVAGDIEAALGFVDKQLALARRLESLDPSATTAFWSMVIAHGQAAEILAPTQRREEFAAHLRLALDAAERLVAMKPDDRRFIANFALRALDVALRVELSDNRIPPARALVARVATHVEQLLRLDPDARDTALAAFELRRTQAWLEAQSGDPRSALDLARSALQLAPRALSDGSHSEAPDFRVTALRALIQRLQSTVPP